MSRITTILGVFCLMIHISFSSSVLAQDSLKLALFNSNKTMISAESACLKIEEHKANATVYCNFNVTPRGSVDSESIICTSHTNSKPYIAQTIKHITSVTFTPATVDSKPIAVKVFMRAFHKERGDNKCGWAAVLNNGYQSKEFGLDYIAPQEIMVDAGFYKEYFDRIRKSFNARTLGQPSKPYVDAVSFMVNDSGQVDKIRFIPSNAKLEIKRILRTSLRDRRFIPGQKDSEPISMNTMLLTGGKAITDVSSYTDQIVTFEKN